MKATKYHRHRGESWSQAHAAGSQGIVSAQSGVKPEQSVDAAGEGVRTCAGGGPAAGHAGNIADLRVCLRRRCGVLGRQLRLWRTSPACDMASSQGPGSSKLPKLCADCVIRLQIQAIGVYWS